MRLIDLLNEINRIIKQSPYTKEQVLELFSAEEEMKPDEIFALCVAMEYMREKKKDPSKLQKEFIKRRDKLMKFYN
jgi:hypothetical protein